MLDPRSDVAKAMEKEGRKNLADSIMLALQYMKQYGFTNELVKVHNKTDVCAITRVDGTMRVTHYIPFQYEIWSGEDSPTLEFSRTEGGLFEKYEKHFDTIWESEESIPLEKFEIQEQ